MALSYNGTTFEDSASSTITDNIHLTTTKAVTDYITSLSLNNSVSVNVYDYWTGNSLNAFIGTLNLMYGGYSSHISILCNNNCNLSLANMESSNPTPQNYIIDIYLYSTISNANILNTTVQCGIFGFYNYRRGPNNTSTQPFQVFVRPYSPLNTYYVSGDIYITFPSTNFNILSCQVLTPETKLLFNQTVINPWIPKSGPFLGTIPSGYVSIPLSTN